MDTEELVSVITPCFNSADYITDTIQSVQNQTYKIWEMFIVDDGSKDKTWQIIQKFAAKDKRIRPIRFQENRGPVISRNTGIREAKGRYIAFLDSDDMWLPTKLEEQISFMRRLNCVLSYTAYKKINNEGHVVSDTIKVPKRVNYRKLLSTNVIACLTAIYDSKILGKVYMPDILKRQDYCLWLKILKEGNEGYGLSKPLALYRVRSRSVSRNKLQAALYQWKVYRKVEKLPLNKSVICMILYAYHGYKKARM